jgi:hypothetical protein
MNDWLKTALQPSVVKRSCKYAVVVGAILISVNHGGAILDGQIEAARWWRMGLTVMVPYLVSTFSSVGAIRQMRRQASEPSAAPVRSSERTRPRRGLNKVGDS